MNQFFSRIVLPMFALSMGAVGFYHVARESQTVAATSPPADPARTPYADSIAASGIVEPRTENIAIGAALSGLVLDVFVPSDRVGAHVTAGQPLFRVDDRHLQAELKVATAELASAEAQLARLEQQPRPEELPPAQARARSASADASRLKDQFERARRLIEKGVITQEEFVTRQQAAEAAAHEAARAQAEYDLLFAGAWQPDIAIAKAAVVRAQAQIEQVQTEISRATVVSPIAGVVLQVNVRPGERVQELDDRALVVLGDLSTYHVRVDVDERDIARFQRGAAAIAYPRGETNQPIDLAFVRVEPYVVPKQSLTGDNTERVDTRVLQVLYAIEDPAEAVYVGQQLDVFINDDPHVPGASDSLADGTGR